MPAQPTSRVRSLAPSPTVAVSEKARALKAQGIDVIDLGGGDPDFITPGFVREAATAAMDAGDTHYVNSSGTPALRSAIAQKLRDDNQLSIDAEHGIVVTPGGKASLFQAFLSYVEPGVDVLLPEPAWVSYRSMIELAGGRVVSVPLKGETGFTLTRDALEQARTPKSQVLLINSPSNPTGHVMGREELHAVAEFAKAHDLLVFSDEIYEKIVYDQHRHLSIAAFEGMASRTLTFNGFSKAYAMTGWRLGYAAGPRELIAPLRTVHSHMVTCATSFVQAGGVAALAGPQAAIAKNVAAWDRRRQFFCDGLNDLPGVRCPRPEGAFYAFADLRESGLTAERLLSEARVAATPGQAFGAPGDGYVRFSFATGDEALHEALKRIRAL